MRTSTLHKPQKFLWLEIRRLLILLALSTLTVSQLSGQAPVWVPTTPSTGITGALTIPVNYGIDITGTIYISVVNFNLIPTPTSAQIKAGALAGPSGARVATAVIPINAGQVNLILQAILDVINVNRLHSVFFVAESSGGVLQAVPIKLLATTLPCPAIDILTGFTQPEICINKVPVATFQTVILNPDPNVNGILKGTQWTLDWGDGTTAAYTSTADNDLPPLAMRTHTYSTITDCNYVFTNGIRNPCNETRAVQYIAVIHGRDIPSDGDGLLQLVNNATGSTTINVCEGTQTIITIRDNSTWNCQNPTLPGGLTPVPNLEPREIEWLYGRDPGGAITNTITGAVDIATLGNAPQASGRFSPVPYGPSSLSQAITIPATCVAGQYFRVYLKNWNKCNWTDPEYVNTFIDILVIAAPPAPTVPNRTICFGAARTLTVTSPPVGTINWYSDALLTTLVGAGVNYTPVQTAVGSYNFWVVDKSLTGLLCQSLPTMVTLTINPIPNKPGITVTGSLSFCFDGVTSVTLTANPNTPPAITTYQWYKNAAPLNTNIANTFDQISQSGTYTLRVYGIAPTSCPSPLSDPVVVSINDPATVGAGVDQAVCSSSPVVTTAGTRGGGATSSTWTTSGTGVFGNAANLITTYTPSAADILAGTVTLTITTNDPAGPCGSVNDAMVVTINPAATVGAGIDQAVCSSSPLVTTAGIRGGGATSSTWTTSGSGVFGNAANLITTYTPSAADILAGTVTLTITTNDPAGPCGSVNDAMVVTINPAATVGAGIDQAVCSSSPVVTTAGTRGGGATSSTWTTSGTGVFGNAANLITTYTPSAADILAGTVTLTITTNDPAGPCGSVNDAMVVTISQAATVNAGPDQGICALASATLAGSIGGSAASATWSGGGGVYVPNNTTLNAVYTPNAAERLAGTVTLTLTTNDPAGPCTAVNDNVIITIGAPLTAATLTGSGNACSGATSTIRSVITGGASPYTINYTRNGVVQPPITPYLSGTNFSLGVLPVGTYNYLITSVTDPCGNTVPPGGLPGVYTITINAIPDITGTIPAAQSICSNGTANITLNSTVNNTIFNYTAASVPAAGYSWTAGKDPVPGSITDADGNGTEPLSRQLQHNYNAAVVVTYTITPTGPGATACLGAAITRTVTVNPVAAVTNMVTTTCGGTAFTVTPVDGANGVVPAGTTYSWPVPVVTGGMTGGAVGAAAANISGTLNNPTNTPQTATYTVTPLSGACTGATFTVTVTVNPKPAIANKVATTCSATAFTVTPVNGADIVPAGTTYSWGVPVVTGGMTGGAAGAASANINGTLNNPTNVAQTATYTVTPLSGACTGATFTVTVTVNPIPAVTAMVATTCSAVAFTVTPVNVVNGIVPAGTTYSWPVPVVTGGMTGGAVGAAAANISGTLNNPTNTPQTATYTVTPLSGACTGATFTVTVTVNPKPAIANKVATTCSATAFTVTPVNGADIVPAGTTYSWGVPVVTGGMTGGAAGAASANINGTLNNPTNVAQTATYTVTPLSGACTGATFTVTVTVNPIPAVTAMVATTCSAIGFTVTPVNVVNGIVPAGTTYSWPVPVVTGGMTGGAAGAAAANISGTLNNPTNTPQTATYTVTPLSGACTGATFTVTVTVNPKPAIANKVATTCSATAFTVTPVNGADIVPAGTTYSWAIPVVTGGMTGGAAGAAAANISGTLNNPTNTPQTATYTVTPLSGACTGANFTVTVTVNPKPAVTAMVATTCSAIGFTVTPVNVVNGIVPAGTTYSWAVPVVTGGMTGGAAGAAAANITGTLTNATTTPQTATYTVTPTSGACAGATFTVTVTVNPAGQVDQPVNQVVCNGANTAAINFTTVNTGGVTTYTWTNSVPGIGLAAAGAGNIGVFAAINAGTAPVVATIIVTPTFTNNAVGCAGPTKTFTITVNPTPTLSTTLTPADVCSNTLFSYAPASATAGTTFNWTRAAIAGITPAGPTAGVNNPNETLINITSAPIAVTYQYTLAANGCSNVQNVVVNIKPEPVITNGQNPAACSGNALNYRILMNNFANPADNVTFTWGAPVLNPVDPGFTGGSARGVPSAANITDIFTNTLGALGTATYTVTPFKNGCTGAPVTVVITVGSEPVLDPGLDAFACSNTPIGLILQEAAGSVVPTYYNIISKTVAPGLSDVGNAVIPNGTAPAAYLSTDVFTNNTGVDKTVTYRVQPILAPDCIGAAVDVVITIRPQPVIFPGQLKTVCSRVSIDKEILLAPPNTPAGSFFNWPVPVMSDASVQGTAGVNVAADPAGTFHFTDQLFNYSAAPIQATYSVTPVSQFGCAGTPVPVVITINPEPVPQPISGRDKICVTDDNIVYNVSAVGGSTFHWTVDPAVGTKTFDFNTNAILIDAAPVAGSGNITVYETNSYGCSGDISTLAVQVYAQPAAENITGPAVVCANSTQVYSVTNRAGSIYSWTVPGGAAIIGDPAANSITIIFANVGGTISVRETIAAGCITNHNSLGVAVNALPTATISGGGTICDGGSRNLSVDFTGVGPYTFTYALDGVPQAPIATASDPYILNVTLAGSYTIVNVSDANCTNNGTGTTTVTFFPKPTGTISGTTELCRGSSTTLTVSLTGTAPYTFTYTDGTTPVTIVGHLTNVFTVSVSPLVNTTYTLTSLTDGNSCTGVVSGSAVINVNQPPALTLTGTNLICYNVNTGSVDMSITGGTAPFGYSWTGPNGFTANTEDISALEAGYYAVVVIDSKGCTATGNTTLTQPPVLNGSAAGTNITCFGADDGTITVSGAVGGAGAHEFTINGGGAWQVSPNFSGLAPGTYDVKMRDAVNPTCILTLNGALLLTQPAVLNGTVVKTDINCFGANNGSIVISAPTGGYGTYGYSINGGATWQGSGNFTNLSPATYNVQIRDAVNTACVITLNGALIVTQPPVLSATVTPTDVTCFGATDGTITISAPAGGHGTYEYSINGGGSWQVSGNYAALMPGTYNVQIRDAAFTGCYIILDAALVISQPAVLQANVASTNVTCNGADDGIISITAPLGGSGTWEYSINGGIGWQIAGLFNGLAPATYDVRIRDAANPLCFIILNAGLQITEPAALNGLVIDTDITCFGANDGVIQITNSAGGYGTYDYSINGGAGWQATGLFTGLTPGTYNVQMRDRAHTACVKILDAALVITEPAVLSATVNSTNVTCFSASDGTITISAPTGGYGSYGYSINGGTSWQGSGNFTNLAPGTYNIRIRDAVNTGCIIALNPAVVITQPAVLSASVVKTNVNCFGAADGTITINGAAGGYGTYEYTINGGANWQASNSFIALIPGFYNVKIRDAVNTGCIITLNGSLNVTEPPVLTANIAKTNVTCNAADNGTIIITSPSGGYGTYEYSINGGAGWQASGSFTGLVPATYNVQIRDAAHTTCVIVLNAALVITEPAVLTATVTPTMISCFGASNGIIAITGATGGYGTYEFSINGGTTWSGLGNFTNVAPGVYDIRIRDAVQTACVITLDPALTITQPPVLSATINTTNISCFGTGDGTITISAPAGGYGTYEYSINGGGSWQGSGSFTALGPGNYNVQIRDAAHTSCVIVLNNAVQITQPAILNAVVTPTNVTCNGASDGIINITAPTGGYGTFEYSIDGGTIWQGAGLFNGLAPATYDIRIRDAVNTTCVITLNPALLITEPSVISATVNSANVSCNGANDGTISISSPTGGYGTYDFSTNGGATWQASGNFTNLIPASYNVQIRDKAHTTCVIILNAALVITEPAALSATLASTNSTCFGANNGTITITNPLGGYGTYSYSINGGSSWLPTGTFTNLAPSTYFVKIRDAAHITCEVTLDPALILTQPPVLSATVASTNVTCNDAADGTITITNPLGGYGTYEYSVNGGANWQASGNFNGLIPGFYNVQIRDAANTSCVIILNGSLQITQPAVLSAFFSKTNVTCNGNTDGSITIVGATGGYGTYEYSINGGAGWQASGSFTGLAPATYNVQIRDAAHTGCIKVLDAAVVISEPLILSATVTPEMVTCFGANDGKITISSPAGGYGTYQYSVNGGSTWQGSGTFTNLSPLTYDVRIRDAANISCVIILNPALNITQPAVLSATLARTNVTCFGGNDGTITISSPAGGYGTYEYSVNGGGAWQASGNFTLLTPGSYNVLIRDAGHNGCVVVLNSTYTITQPGLLAATVTKTDVSCQGANDGTITISSPTGGYGTYQYSVDGGASWVGSNSFVNLVPATYDVRMRDAANIACAVILYPNMVITEPVILALTSTGDILLDCFSDMDGSGTFFGSGGTMPYNFVVISNTTGATMAAPGFNSQTFFNAGAGTITIAVTDFSGCFAQATINVTQPALLTPGTIAANQVLCAGDNPAQLIETVPAAGGPGAYNYQWQYGSTAVGPFINIAGATSSPYTPPAGALNTLYYRRMITSGICMPVYSNVIQILVNPIPLAILTGGETICPSQNSILKVNMMVGTGPYEVDIENHGTVSGYVSGADIIVSPAVTTTYRLLRVRDANGCEVLSPSANLIGSAVVTVRTLPAITTSPVSVTTCEFSLVTFNVTATGSDLTYQWFVNTGSGFNPVADGGIYFGATNSTLSLFGVTRLMNGYIYHVEVSGCSTTVTSADATLTVNTIPEIVIQPKDTTACQNAGATFSVTATGTAITYQWQVNTGSGFNNVIDDANFSGSNLSTLTITNAQAAFNNYIFRVIISGTCGVPVYSNLAVLRVSIPPAVSLNPVNRAICDGTGPVVFIANGSGIIDSLRWQVFSGGIWSDVHDNAIYSGSTSQQLTLNTVPLALNGNQYRLALKAKCITVNTTGATLTVNPNPVVDFSSVDPINACGNVPIVINGNPTGGSGTWSSHLWTGDVGPLDNFFVQAPTFNSQIAGTYALNYRVRDNLGCYGNGDVTVIVDAPEASFTQDKSNACTPATVAFFTAMTDIAKFWWDFGDGSPKDSVSVNPVHIFTNATPSSINYYDVELTVMSAGGCTDSFTSTVTVYPSVDATFTAAPAIICSGNQVTFTSLPGASKYFWDFGDGVNGYFTNATNHLYTNFTPDPVVRIVTLTTTSFYNCTDIKTISITVMPVPLPQFTATPVSQIYNAAGNSVTFTNSTNPGTWTWLWNFGDGATSTSQSPTHTYSGLGTFDVVLRVSNANCSDSVKHQVTITPIPPVAAFDPIPSGCSPWIIDLNNTSLNTNAPGTTYMWDFGDGSASTAKNPTYTYFTPGTYKVELTVTGPGGTSTFSQVVNAYASPMANFQVTPAIVFVNDEKVRCFNLTQGADSYLWEFGDGDTSKVEEPFHKYMEEGVYDITLWAYKHNVINNELIVCSDKYVLEDAVTVEPAGELRFSTIFTPNKDAEIDMDHLPTGGTEIDQFFFPPIREKVVNYKLQIFNRLGVLIFESHDINKPWNGYYRNKLCQQGVYVWYVEGKYANGMPFKKVGDVTLLH